VHTFVTPLCSHPHLFPQICDATRTKTVTLQGDVYDPSGTISGGSNKNLGKTLAMLTQLANAKKERTEVEFKVSAVRKEWDALRAVSEQYGKLSEQVQIATAELEAAAKHLGQTKFGMLEEQFENMSAEVAEAAETKVRMVKDSKTKWALYNELKGKEKELTAAREDKLKGIEADIIKAKKVADETAAKAQEIGNNAETLKLELESLEKEVVAAEDTVATMKKASLNALEEKAALESQVEEQQDAYAVAKQALELVEAKIDDMGKELKQLSTDKTKLKKEAETATLEAKRLQVTVKRFGQEKGQAEKFVKNSVGKHPWIESEKEHFGVAGGDYDFEALDPVATTIKLKKLREEQVRGGYGLRLRALPFSRSRASCAPPSFRASNTPTRRAR